MYDESAPRNVASHNPAIYVHDGDMMDTGKTLIAFRVPTPASKWRLAEIGRHKTSPYTRSCASLPTGDDASAAAVMQPGSDPHSASILAVSELLRRRDQPNILPDMGGFRMTVLGESRSWHPARFC